MYREFRIAISTNIGVTNWKKWPIFLSHSMVIELWIKTQESRIEFLWPAIDGYSAVNIRVVQMCVVVVKTRYRLWGRDETKRNWDF
jgi:hypothetical protein